MVNGYSQEAGRKFKCDRINEAVKLIDEGKYDESILILRECEKVDPTDYTYPYEIALAYTYKKEYAHAIDQLLKIGKYRGLRSDYYQLLGNNYDYMGDGKKALETYDKGLRKFPKAGRLFLEKGVVFEGEKEYLKAIKEYEKGIKAEPQYPSNYYRAARLYLSSKDKLSGLIYGEIFMNLERTTSRTRDMSKLLFDTYKNSIKFEKDKSKLDFCEIILDVKDLKSSNLKLPLCAMFGKNMSLAIITESEVTLSSVSRIRTNFLKYYLESDQETYPNVLFSYWKELQDNKHFEMYNHYLLQVGAVEDFEAYVGSRETEFNSFVEWYTKPENMLELNEKNAFISDSIK